jgi:hypothetical protein
MKNIETVEQIEQKVKEAIAHDPFVKDIEKFNLKDISINDTLMLGKRELNDKSIKRILDILNVKPAFTEYKKSMSEKDWQLVANRIKEAKGDLYLYGEMTGDSKVNNIFGVNPNKKSPDDSTNSLSVIEKITEELKTSDYDFSLENFSFNKENYLFDIGLKNNSCQLDVLPGDTWKVGSKFTFNSLQFKHTPYFERLICSNGMLGQQLGFRSDISKSTFNNDKLGGIINKAIKNINESHLKLLEEHAETLKNVNLSVGEFLTYRSWFTKGNRGEYCDNLVNKYFTLEPLYKAYGGPVNEKSWAWKKSADTGINAYDFLNLLTWIGSHTKESGLEKQDATDLQIMASSLYFNKAFDMREIAPKVNVSYPRFAEMQ